MNNVGIFEPKPFAETTDADWMRLFETNVLGGVRLARDLLPGMLARGWGRITNGAALRVDGGVVRSIL